MTYKEDFNKKYGFKKDKSHTLAEISKITGYELKGLKTIYDKGMGAYKTNPQSVRKNVKSPQQWAQARVYASVNPKSKSYKVDKVHLVKKGKKELTDKQKDMLEKHKVHHTKKHMDFMKKEMMKGSSFTTAHQKAKKMVGK